MKITEIKLNKSNPRLIKDHKFEKLKKSITEFPKMLELRPIIIDNDNIILGGNMRYQALKDCGYWISRNDKRVKVKIDNENIIINEFVKLFEVCDDLNYKIWGLKTEGSKISQHDEKPFVFLTYVTASCMGIVNDKEFLFDESYLLKEDYEIGLRHIEKKGGVIGARHFHWENEHWGVNGGCGDYRDDLMERKMINKLIRQYPKYVKSVNRKNSQYCIKLHF